MRTWTVVVDAISSAGRREATALAARGKDLVLIGAARAPLEILSAELRVIHGVDVRILALDLARPDHAEEAIRWLRERDRAVDGIVAARDPSLRRGVERLAAAFLPEMRRRGLGTVRCVEAGDERSITLPPVVCAPSRARTTTQRGFSDA